MTSCDRSTGYLDHGEYSRVFQEPCESDRSGFYVLVLRMTNMDATINRKIMDATVKKTGF